MTALAFGVVAVAAAANLAIALADVARAEFVLANSAEVGVPERWLPGLAALKAAGAIGLLLGAAGVPVVGVAAAAGLVLFFVGALVTHVRAAALHSIGFPGLYLGLAVASLIVLIAQ